MIDRIKQVIEYVQLSPSAFADTIGISRSGMTHLLTGRNQPSLDVAKKILAKYPEISTEWLIMGMGEMFRPEEQQNTKVNEVKAEASQKSYPDENSKFNRQTDLFGEFENAEKSQEDVIEETSAEVPANPMQETEVVNDTKQEEPFADPQPVTEPSSADAQPVLTRPRKSMDARPAAGTSRVRRQQNDSSEKKLQKIIFIYDDRSFEVFSAC
jgi:DNA-binding XRE family transcriptional regulator